MTFTVKALVGTVTLSRFLVVGQRQGGAVHGGRLELRGSFIDCRVGFHLLRTRLAVVDVHGVAHRFAPAFEKDPLVVEAGAMSKYTVFVPWSPAVCGGQYLHLVRGCACGDAQAGVGSDAGCGGREAALVYDRDVARSGDPRIDEGTARCSSRFSAGMLTCSLMVLPSVTRASRPTKSVNAASAPSAMRMVVSAVSSSSMMISAGWQSNWCCAAASELWKRNNPEGLCIFELGVVHNPDVNQCLIGIGLKSHYVRRGVVVFPRGPSWVVHHCISVDKVDSTGDDVHGYLDSAGILPDFHQADPIRSGTFTAFAAPGEAVRDRVRIAVEDDDAGGIAVRRPAPARRSRPAAGMRRHSGDRPGSRFPALSPV